MASVKVRSYFKNIQQAATEEKSILEEAQRFAAKERKATGFEWVPKYFEWVWLSFCFYLQKKESRFLPDIDNFQDSDTESYIYLHSDLRPWDPLNDLQQYEKDFIVCTRTMHKTPMIRQDL